MKIHLLSDIHLEFGLLPIGYREPDCDVVVIAGDVHPGPYAVDWMIETYTKPVIYVLGNHCHWDQGRPMKDTIALMKAEAKGSNVHVLDNETVVIDGVRFLGSTLWTDFNLYGNGPIAMMGEHTKDCDRILHDYNEPFTPNRMVSEHNISRFFLSEELRKPFDGKTVVVTHHAPSELSIAPQYHRGDMGNTAYASRMEDLMLDFNPEVWIHGHTHTTFDYMIGDTRILCNPRGYKDFYENKDFNSNLVIEV